MNREKRRQVIVRASDRLREENCHDPTCGCCGQHNESMKELIQAFEELGMDIDDANADPQGALLRLAWSAFQDNPNNGGAVDRDYKAVLKAMGGRTVN